MRSRIFSCVLLGALAWSTSAQSTDAGKCTTIAEALQAGFPTFATFLAGDAALAQQLAVSEDAYTLFLPTDEVAIAALGGSTISASNLFDLVQLAIVPGSYPAVSLKDGDTLETQGGPLLTVAISASTVSITGPQNTVTVAKADAFYPLCSGSVIHLVDAVLLPANFTPNTTIVVSPGANVTANGTDVLANGTATAANGTVR